MRKLKIAAALLVAASLVLIQQLGLFERLSDPAGLKQALLGLGSWGYLVFVLSYAAIQPFGFPGSVFIWTAPLIWPWPVAFGLSMVGTQAASVIGFSLARFIARDFVSDKIPERFKKYNEALAQRAFTTVFLLRLIFWMPPPLHAFFGVSKVSFWTHFWGSLAGYALPLFLVSFFGERIFDALKELPAAAWVAIAVAVLATGFVLWRRRIPPKDQRSRHGRASQD